jgi:hypothetical protein
MSEDREKFLSRWARLKERAREAPPANPAEAAGPPPELPPLDTLGIDSDFKAFLHPAVDDNLRRAALKKLFSDPRFNVMDGLDVYIDDYSKSEPIPLEMLRQLVQAQNIFAASGCDQKAPDDPSAVAAVPGAGAGATLPPPAEHAAPGPGTAPGADPEHVRGTAKP